VARTRHPKPARVRAFLPPIFFTARVREFLDPFTVFGLTVTVMRVKRLLMRAKRLLRR
jgi:hypothetical protein